MFFSLQNKTKLVPGKLGVRCGPGLLSASRARRSPSCRRGGGSRLAVGAPLLARRPRRPPLPPRPRRPARAPPQRAAGARAWLAPSHAPGPLSEPPPQRGRPARSRGLREPRRERRAPRAGRVPSLPLAAAPPAPLPGPAPGESPCGLRFAPGRDKVSARRPGAARRRGAATSPDLVPAAPTARGRSPPRPSAPLRARERASRRRLRGRSRRSHGTGVAVPLQLGRVRAGGLRVAERSGAQLTGLRGSSRRGRGQTDAEAEREGAREGPPRSHGRSREPPPPPLSEPPFLPPRLRATDGAAGGMTGNSWARAAESKYEQRRRAREDGERARRRRGRLPGLGGRQFPPPPSEPPKADLAGEARCHGHPFPTWGPKCRAGHPAHGSHLRPLEG